ncbi:TadA family conjugal transfer-associated ATPase [Jatrophihabitans telluris]|uniref:TadA family conjugal transfer-associated ATPase n=1 Tax=Jatrophihabitans telluris TaxID=2038343 RepID=A0ABY4QZ72_9ACTN|nr:TadA family conjugal transfer-associated ATPase [Jatrophihabitans telluris]UQX88149.1 TadA family conjugal transfer-associated ATPase [Jatrophihabitans telluris]
MSAAETAGGDRLVDRVRTELARGAPDAAFDRVATAQIAQRSSGLVVDSLSIAELSGALAAEFSGAGVLQPLLERPGTTDVLVNGAEQVWVDDGSGLTRAEVRFSTQEAVRALACRLAASCGRRLDDSSPFVDAVLADGTRLHAVLPPVAAVPTLSLRIVARRRWRLGDLDAAGMMAPGVADLLRACVGARLSLLLSGGTGTGKTTLLAALLAEAGPRERIVTIEDARELAVDHPHVVSLVTRSANIERSGAIDLAELVRQSLRMRADRVVVGEFRGAEMIELLAALNTGHAGGAATVHANSTRDVPSRLVALAALGGMPADVLQAQTASAIELLVHLRRAGSGLREVSEIALAPQPGEAPGANLVWSMADGPGPRARALRRLLRERGRQDDTVPELLS